MNILTIYPFLSNATAKYEGFRQSSQASNRTTRRQDILWFMIVEYVAGSGSNIPIDFDANGEFIGPNTNRMRYHPWLNNLICVPPSSRLEAGSCGEERRSLATYFGNKGNHYCVWLIFLIFCSLLLKHLFNYFLIMYCRSCLTSMKDTETQRTYVYGALTIYDTISNMSWRSHTSHALLINRRWGGTKDSSRTSYTSSLSIALLRRHIYFTFFVLVHIEALQILSNIYLNGFCRNPLEEIRLIGRSLWYSHIFLVREASPIMPTMRYICSVLVLTVNRLHTFTNSNIS